MTDDQTIATETDHGTARNHEPILQFFAYQHLPGNLQSVSKPFYDMAHGLMAKLPRNPERSAALRKLLEAKDCAVRAFIFKDD